MAWQDYHAYPSSQRSDMFQLEEGGDYLVVSEFVEGSGSDFINVCKRE